MLTHSVVNRVIQEVAGTIATNGIQELSSEERGGVSTRGYVCACLKSTAYNAVRSMPGFNMSYGEFCRAVDASVDAALQRPSDPFMQREHDLAEHNAEHEERISQLIDVLKSPLRIQSEVTVYRREQDGSLTELPGGIDLGQRGGAQ